MLNAQQRIQVVDRPQYTRNLFGPAEKIAGKTLELLERNPDGDCLCVFHGRLGQNIVDVDHRDVVDAGANLLNLTEAEMTKLRNTKSETEWNAVCDEIKAARNGVYPPDWLAKMMLTGLMAAIMATWK